MTVLCPRCETLPEPIQGAGTLYIRAPLMHTFAKLKKHLQASDLAYREEQGLLVIDVSQSQLDTILSTLATCLTSTEQDDTKVLFQAVGKTLAIADCFNMDNLDNMLTKANANWLIQLIKDKALTCHFQPIVDFRNNETIYAYECLLRAVVGDETIYPGKIFSIAKKADMLFQVDLAAREISVKEAARHNIEKKLFINFSPNAIYDPIFCLSKTLRLIDEVNISREQIVFEVTETESVTNMDHLLKIIRFYKETGFKVALDDLGSGFSSLNLLAELKPDYIKLDIGLIKDINQNQHKAVIMKKMIEVGKLLDITILAEGIETKEEYDWCKSADVDLGQGFYFAYPANPPVTTIGDFDGKSKK